MDIPGYPSHTWQVRCGSVCTGGCGAGCGRCAVCGVVLERRCGRREVEKCSEGEASLACEVAGYLEA